MLCQFERLVYPQNTNVIDAASYMVALYRPCEKIKVILYNKSWHSNLKDFVI